MWQVYRRVWGDEALPLQSCLDSDVPTRTTQGGRGRATWAVEQQGEGGVSTWGPVTVSGNLTEEGTWGWVAPLGVGAESAQACAGVSWCGPGAVSDGAGQRGEWEGAEVVTVTVSGPRSRLTSTLGGLRTHAKFCAQRGKDRTSVSPKSGWHRVKGRPEGKGERVDADTSCEAAA